MDWADAVQQIHTLLSQLSRPGSGMIPSQIHATRDTASHSLQALASSWGHETTQTRPAAQQDHPDGKASTRNAATLPACQLAPPGPQQARAEASSEHTEEPDPRRIAYAAEDRRRRTIGRLIAPGTTAGLVTLRARLKRRQSG